MFDAHKLNHHPHPPPHHHHHHHLQHQYATDRHGNDHFQARTHGGIQSTNVFSMVWKKSTFGTNRPACQRYSFVRVPTAGAFQTFPGGANEFLNVEQTGRPDVPMSEAFRDRLTRPFSLNLSCCLIQPKLYICYEQRLNKVLSINANVYTVYMESTCIVYRYHDRLYTDNY